MNLLVPLVAFIFGTIIGSFLNVVIYRYGSGTSPMEGRSRCFACGETLKWYELVPIMSWLIQGGRCRGCKTRVSVQYLIVEVITGLTFVAIFLINKPVPETLYLILIFSSLIVMAVYDIRHQIIPDGIVAFFSVLSLGWFLWTLSQGMGLGRLFTYPFIWTLLAGPILFFPFWALWAVSRGRWIGLGDGKLALGIGWFLGATLGGSAIMLGFWVGALYALVFMGADRLRTALGKKHTGKKLSMKSEIPFGPFLILGVFIVYFTHWNFFDGSITFFNIL